MNKEKNIPEMPKDYIGKELSGNDYTNERRKWTQKEIEWCLALRKEGFTISEIAKSCKRGKTSVSTKLKRLSKNDGTYNRKNIAEKYAANEKFFELIKPKTILDVYCGPNHFWSNKVKHCVSNDKEKSYEATFHMNALDLCCQEYLAKHKYDLIDLDPYGSAYDCLDLSIKLAQKALIVTYGEFGQRRWKRTDYVKSTFGINNVEEFIPEKFIKETQRIGRHNHKNLIPEIVCEYGNIIRVYYRVEPIKITEQWEKKVKK